MQDVFLFAGTAEENLRLGNTRLSKADLERACETVHADFLKRLESVPAARARSASFSFERMEKEDSVFLSGLMAGIRWSLITMASESPRAFSSRMVTSASSPEDALITE